MTPRIQGDPPVAALPTGFGNRKELGTVAFERTRMPMVVTDARAPDNTIVLANKAFLALTGYAADEVLGQNCRMLQGPLTSPTAVAEIRRALVEGREVDVELLNYRKDGTTFLNQLHISPIHDDDGEIAYYFASQIDVTQYRKVQALEASEHRLLMEVDHRAKNALAIVDSLVRLSKSDDAGRYAAAVQRRVQALSTAHSLLSERGWKSVSLRDVIHSQVGSHEARSVAFDGPDITVAASVVQPLSLVIHELTVNATLHGALSKSGGTLSLSWKQTDDSGGFRIAWTESGAPPHAIHPKSGFGTLMVKAMVEKQLSGSIRRVWKERGLEIVLEVPGSP